MYCIDASSLIHGWRRDYPPDIFQSLWDQLDELARQGKLFSSVEVLSELERGGDDLYKWAKEREHIFLEADAETQKFLSSIVESFPKFVPSTSNDGIWADPYLIAFAAANKWIVVTGEKTIGPAPGAKKMNIPNVCQALGIEYIDLLQLIRKEGWRF